MALRAEYNDDMGCSDTVFRRYSVTTHVDDDGDYFGDYISTNLLAHEVGHTYFGTHDDSHTWSHSCGWFCTHLGGTIMIPDANEIDHWHDVYSDANADTIRENHDSGWQDGQKRCHYTLDESVYDEPCT